MGMAAQGMDGRKKGLLGYVFQYTPGSYTFIAPQAGYWKFVLWGSSDGLGGQASGGYCERTVFLGVQQSVAFVCGAGGSGGAGNPSTATFPDGRVVSAGAGSTVGGVATGGDVNLDGSVPGVAGQGTGGGAANSGAGAPANLPFRGGAGISGGLAGRTPGGGSGSVSAQGADGMIIAVFVRP